MGGGCIHWSMFWLVNNKLRRGRPNTEGQGKIKQMKKRDGPVLRLVLWVLRLSTDLHKCPSAAAHKLREIAKHKQMKKKAALATLRPIRALSCCLPANQRRAEAVCFLCTHSDVLKRGGAEAEVPLSKASNSRPVGFKVGVTCRWEKSPKSPILTDGVKVCSVLLRATAVFRAAVVKVLSGRSSMENHFNLSPKHMRGWGWGVTAHMLEISEICSIFGFFLDPQIVFFNRKMIRFDKLCFFYCEIVFFFPFWYNSV